VLAGHGDVFCPGGDYDGAGPATAGRMVFGRAYIDMAEAMARLGKPLIAAVNGNAHAGGFKLVAACDMAFMANGTTLGLPEAAHGVFPFLALAVVRDGLPKKVLFDIVYNARLIGAEEACALHLVNQVMSRHEVLPRAIEAVEKVRGDNLDVLMMGRDLYQLIAGFEVP
jgi:enoyl-CoA hydratase/carnithine racemase